MSGPWLHLTDPLGLPMVVNAADVTAVTASSSGSDLRLRHPSVPFRLAISESVREVALQLDPPKSREPERTAQILTHAIVRVMGPLPEIASVVKATHPQLGVALDKITDILMEALNLTPVEQGGGR